MVVRDWKNPLEMVTSRWFLMEFVFMCASMTAKCDIPVARSENSMIVVPVRVGSRGQSLLMAVTFDSQVSFLYTEAGCLPFVECFEPDKSSSYHPPTLLSRSGYDMLDVPNYGRFRFSFLPVSVVDTTTLRNRDVAGILSLNPRTGVFSRAPIWLEAVNERIAVKGIYHRRTHWKMRFGRPPKWAILPHVTASVPVVSYSWDIDSTLSFTHSAGSAHHSVVTRIVPDLEDIVLSGSLRDQLRGHIQGDRLYVICSGEGSAAVEEIPSIIVTIDTTSVAVDPSNLVVLGNDLWHKFESIETPHGDWLCPTHIRFHDDDTVRLGLPFIASVDSVLFHGHRVTIYINPEETDRDATWNSSFKIPRLPRFGYPVIEDRSRGVSVVFGTEWKTVVHSGKIQAFVDQLPQLVLSNREPIVIDSNEIAYHFVKVDGRISRNDSFMSPSGTFAKPTGLEIKPGHVILNLDRALAYHDEDKYIVRIIDHPEGYVEMRIIKTDLADLLHDYSLVDPFLFGSRRVNCPVAGDASRCAICLTDYAPGDRLQSMQPNCGHIFHEECAARWINGRGWCCVCRERIRKRAAT
jgi:hypothetical protein